MRSISLFHGALVAAVLASASLAGCAVEDDFDDQAELELGESEEELVSAAAAPSLALFATPRCRGMVLNVSGEAVSNRPVTLTFNGLAVANNGGSFSFNPGGSGTLKAKACSGSSCTTRTKPIQWVSCHGGGGGGGGGPIDQDPR
jgi:hypothetical protein